MIMGINIFRGTDIYTDMISALIFLYKIKIVKYKS